MTIFKECQWDELDLTPPLTWANVARLTESNASFNIESSLSRIQSHNRDNDNGRN